MSNNRSQQVIINNNIRVVHLLMIVIHLYYSLFIYLFKIIIRTIKSITPKSDFVNPCKTFKNISKMLEILKYIYIYIYIYSLAYTPK
jgi:hypothetical protein